MNREDIIRMAAQVESELTGHDFPHSYEFIEWCERFATLVAAANKPETAIAEAYRCGWEAGATATRDACIALCDEHWKHNGNAMECADSIRVMGKAYDGGSKQ